MPCRQTDLRAPLHIWKAPAASLPLSAALPEEPQLFFFLCNFVWIQIFLIVHHRNQNPVTFPEHFLFSNDVLKPVGQNLCGTGPYSWKKQPGSLQLIASIQTRLESLHAGGSNIKAAR